MYILIEIYDKEKKCQWRTADFLYAGDYGLCYFHSSILGNGFPMFEVHPLRHAKNMGKNSLD
jgi:hypothetical protein